MKKMVGSIVLAALSSAAFANIIVPEISRDGKTKNTSVIATAQQKRTYVSLESRVTTLESGLVEQDVDQLDLYGGFSTESFTFEGMLAETTRADAMEYDSSIMQLQFGYRFDSGISVGLNYYEDDIYMENNTDDLLELGISYNHNGLVYGLSVSDIASDDNDSDGFLIQDTSHTRWIVGVGSNENKMSWEAGLIFDKENTEFDSTSPQRYAPFFGMTRYVNNVELDTTIAYAFGDLTVDGGSYSEIGIDFDAEFLLSDKFYITPGFLFLAGNNNYSEGGDYSEVTLSTDFGFRGKNIDTNIGFSYALLSEAERSSGTVDIDKTSIDLNFTYRF